MRHAAAHAECILDLWLHAQVVCLARLLSRLTAPPQAPPGAAVATAKTTDVRESTGVELANCAAAE
jgi:hypothetical protein